MKIESMWPCIPVSMCKEMLCASEVNNKMVPEEVFTNGTMMAFIKVEKGDYWFKNYAELSFVCPGVDEVGDERPCVFKARFSPQSALVLIDKLQKQLNEMVLINTKKKINFAEEGDTDD